MERAYTISEIEGLMGERIRELRLSLNLDQKTVSERAGLSVRALKNLEQGNGSTLRSLVAVMRILGRRDWLLNIAQVATINPLTLTRAAHPRLRARPKKHGVD
jgi:transcriptional regulator with XRE-family HTH domain